MSLLIGFLTFIIVVDCLFLMLLVLIQLPKKEAGIGTAFGGGATDALFGAGSGNVLTKLTKYSTGIFLGLAMVLSVLIINQSRRPERSSLEEELSRKSGAIVPALSNALPAITPALTNMMLSAPTSTTTVPAPANSVPVPATPPTTPPPAEQPVNK